MACRLTGIVSDNGSSPDRRKAIVWTNAGILLIWPLGTNFSVGISVLRSIDAAIHQVTSTLSYASSQRSFLCDCWRRRRSTFSFYLFESGTKWMRYCPFMRGLHQPPVDSLHKGQWREALMFSLICAWTNGWANDPDACDLRRLRAYYDVTVIFHCNSNSLEM